MSFQVNGAVDLADVGRGDDEKGVGRDVAGLVAALMPLNFTGCGELGDARAGPGRDDGDRGVGSAQRFDLALGKIARADDQAAAAGELEEDGEEVHELHYASTTWRPPAGAGSRSTASMKVPLSCARRCSSSVRAK